MLPRLRRLSFLLTIVCGLFAAGSPLNGQTSLKGQWSAAFSMQLVAVHAALMRTGQLLLFDAWEIPGTPSATLWDPTTNAYTNVPNGFAELFCSGHTLSNDGRLITTGGHNGSGVGTRDATVFDPGTQQWTPLSDLTYARWYPSLIQLADGRALTLGGAISRPAIAEIPEALSLSGGGWTTFPAAQKDVGEYPTMFQTPNGSVFVAADASNRSWLLDPSLSTWTSLGPSPAGAGAGVMYRPGKVMMTGGGTLGTDPVTGATSVIDLNAATPTWRQTPAMAFGRSQHTLVLLPDGKVMVIGGAAEVSLISTNGVLTPEIWDPAAETWTQVAPMSHKRMYHSTAILLPDGRVLAAGGGRINVAVTDELNGEFYSPPYLFRGTRPVVTAAPSSVAYGAAFTLSSPAPSGIARVTFVRASSVTHGINLDQRFYEASFTQVAGGVSVTAPSDTRTTPAGDYLVFALDASDVPSLGRVVRLGSAPGAASLAVSDASVNEGTATGGSMVFTVSLAGSSAQTVTVNYATQDDTALAGSDYTSTSGTLSFPPGTASRTVSVPITADAVVEPNESFTLRLSGATNATIADGIGVGTIVNDDISTLSSLSINSVSVTEGTGAGSPVAAFTVTLSPASAQNVVVSYRTLAGTATSPADYTSTSGTLTFAGGTTVQTIQVPIVTDALVEGNETFSVELYNPSQAALGMALGTGTILDDDGIVTSTFVVASGADDVNEDGTTFTPDASLVWLGSGASATGSYLGLRFTGVTIPAGATITSAHVEVNALSTQWTSMAFEMAGEASGNSAAFTSAATPSGRTLLAPRVQHSSDAQWVTGTRYSLEDITTVVQAAVQQPAWATGNALSLVFRGTGSAWARKHVASAENGAATAPRLVVTYTTGSGPVNQPPTITSATATPTSGVAPLIVQFAGAATDPEGAPVTYTWTFGDGQSAAGASVSHTYAAAGIYGATLTVSDGTASRTSAPIAVTATSVVLPTLSIGDVTVTEGQSGATVATFLVTLSAPNGTVTVNYATSSGTAVPPSDYATKSGTLTFTGATTSLPIAVSVVGETVVEPNETFSVILSNPVGATLARATGVGTIVNDDSAGGGGPVTATFVVTNVDDDVNEDGATFTPDAGLWIGNGSSATGSYLGLRFTGVGIPAGATVSEAHVELTAAGTAWNAMAFEWAAEASGNSAAFSAASRPSQRTLLVPRVQHSSNVQWVSGTPYALDDIKTIVQAVVTQPAWVSGQSLSLVVRGTGGAWARKFAAAVESGATTAPRLVVTYTSGGGPANLPPSITSATGTPTSGLAPLPVQFTGAATDPEGAALTYTWTFGDGQTGAGASISHTYAAAGNYAASLAVSDGTTSVASAPIGVTVSSPNLPPSITSATGTPTSGLAPLPVQFTGAATDPEGAALTYTWTFGDGQTGTGTSVGHTYAATGNYSASLSVSDGTTTVVSAPIAVTVSAVTMPTLAISDVTVTEGQSGTTVATFVVTRSAVGSTVSVNYATADGTALAPGDYTATAGTLTFTGTTASLTISVPVVGDTAVEPNETFSVVLSNPVGATLADATGVGTITNDDSSSGTPVTATFVVAAGADDVNEDGATFTATSNTVWIGNGSSAAASYIGLRFAGVTIPVGSTVTEAHLELTASSTQWNSLTFEMGAEAAGNSAAFSTSSKPSQRTLLVPRVTHTSNVQWVSGTRYSLDDIKTVVQAVVNQPAWASGQAVGIVVRGTAGAWARKFLAAAENGAATAPRLVVTYRTP